jgi:hypothetical protein
MAAPISEIEQALRSCPDAATLDCLSAFARDYCWDSVIADAEYAADEVMSALRLAEGADLWVPACELHLRARLVESAERRQEV